MASFPNRHSHARTLAAFTAAIALSLTTGAGIALAATAGGSAGSVGAPLAPKLRGAICLTQCVGLDKAIVGSTVQVSGKNMAAAETVSFRKAAGKKRLLAPVVSATATSAQAVVPQGARSGKLVVHDAYGQMSKPGKEPVLVRPQRSLRPAGPLRLADAGVFPRRVLYNGVRSATLSFVIGGGQPSSNLRVDVVTSSGQVVQSFLPTGIAPNTTHSLSWNGTGLDGLPVPTGWYSFRVSRADGISLRRATASQAPNLGVAVYDAIFPIRGKHTYGDGIGAPRSGHTHQGQDVFAACGTPLVAARGGKVQYTGYQGSAGNYLVIDLAGSGEDHAYMHLAAPSLLPVGSRVKTGQPIGNVGDSGNASGCHLHFEIWSAPGWYEGGTFTDPAPSLKAWDKYS